MQFEWIIAASVLQGVSGLPSLADRRRAATGLPFAQWIAAALMLASGALGVFGALGWLLGGTADRLVTEWTVLDAKLTFAIDSLSAFFLVPVYLVPALGAMYGLSYWRRAEHSENVGKLTLMYGPLASGMAFVVLAGDGLTLLLAWEVMALSAYFLITTEDDNAEACQSGWVYLVATHLGALSLFALFALWRTTTGSFALNPAGAMPAATATALFLLALAGFGLKAGLVPLHVWLPGAHANAPSHVSAVLSGVMLKVGIYGIVRITSLFAAPPRWWGELLIVVGALSGIAGIVFALGQRDLKRLLAYSSIENIGIIAIGLGLALVGRAAGRVDWTLLGLAGALFHVWNHSLFKSLLFFNAGAVIHATGTRDIEQLGGLARNMPVTTVLFAIGAIAICGLPPLNGFPGELLIYLGLFRTVTTGAIGGAAPMVALAAVALALIGALALACFVKLLGIVLLGQPRSAAHTTAHESPLGMTWPRALLAALCVGLGLAPFLAAPALTQATRVWLGGVVELSPAALADLAPLSWVSSLNLVLLACASAIGVWIYQLASRSRLGHAVTWDCGYAQPRARMQYTASSFAQMLGSLFGWAQWLEARRPALRGPFPTAQRFETRLPDPVLDRCVLPLSRVLGRCLPWFRLLQRGRVQVYILYFVAIVLLLALWGARGGRP